MKTTKTVELVGGPVDGEKHEVPEDWVYLEADVRLGQGGPVLKYRYAQTWRLTGGGLEVFELEGVVKV
jgi:hypothetical protein